MDPTTKLLAAVPLALFYPLVLAAAAGVGYLLNSAARATPQLAPDMRPVAGAAAAAAGAAATIYAASRAKQVRDGASVIDLYNVLVDIDAPEQLTPEDVKAVGDRFGINMHKDQLDGLQKIYGQYLESIIPTGDQQLRGDEAAKVSAFKDALGLPDEEAAPIHIEVGRRLSRIGFEFQDRQAQFEQRKAFQRLIYISFIVFGDQKSSFLLPWRRVFNLTDAQLFVARRDNARAIFAQHLAARGGELPADRAFLRELRDFQLSIKLFDESAEEAVRAAARSTVERHLAAAAAAMRAPGRSKDTGAMVAEIRSLVEYARKLQRYANDDDLVPGLGLPSIHGGPWDVDTKRREVRDVVKAYMEAVVEREGEFSADLDSSVKELGAVLCLGARDMGEIRGDVCASLYKRLLREEVTSRRIDNAPSPAAVLEQLVRKSGWTPEGAAELHLTLYRQKLTQLVAKKQLTAEDAEELRRIRRILCIPADQAAAAVKATAGRVLEEALTDVFLMGAKPLGELEAERVESVIQDLQLERPIARDILAETAVARFKAYVQQALKEKDRKTQAQVLKKLVQFNALVVTPILEKIQGLDAAKKELAGLLTQAAEGAKADDGASGEEAGAGKASTSGPGQEGGVQSLQRMMAAARSSMEEEEERHGQKEITLGDALDKATRAELYKNYLMYSMSGDVVQLPVGGVVRKRQNLQARQAEMTRLQTLGDLLGMTQVEVAAVHYDLAEQAYRAQAKEVLGTTGNVTPERKAYLEDMAKQLGLQQAAADRILREVRTEILGSAAAMEDGQRWTVEKVLELHGKGVDVAKALDDSVRRALLRRVLEEKLEDGKAEFDAPFLVKELPSILGIDEKRVAMLLKELVGSRKRLVLVQAVSQARQRRPVDAVTSLNNLLSAYRAQPEAAGGASVQWGAREELRDLYGIYCAQVDDGARRAELAALLGLTDDEAAELAAGADRTLDSIRRQQQEEESFF